MNTTENMANDNEVKPTTNGLKGEDETPATNGKSIEANEKTIALRDSDDDELKNISEAEGQVKKIPYPKSVFFIISNEFCERFNYYGMRTILVLYLSRNIGYSDDNATVVFHIFTMLVYFLCVFGAILSDSWLGKFKTIFFLSLVYVCGSIMVTLGAIPTLNLPAETFTIIGLVLVALGSGGIKPCVAAFGGDQFKMPEQVKQVTYFFSLFYFSINAGSLISTSVTPILREDVHCFGEKECYSLAFGVPAILMAVSIVIFVLGRPLYKVKPPAGNMFVLVSKTIGNAISTRWSSKEKRDHWLDYADQKYDKDLIADVKVLMRVLVLYIPLPIFWALFDQQGSRWTFQATRMDGNISGWDLKPDQMQVLNPLLILLFIPLYDIAFYPALSLIGIRRPLQKLTLGGILAGVAFVISGIVELQLEKTYPTLPQPYNAQLRMFNGDACDYTITTNIDGQASFILKSLDAYVYKDIHVPEKRFDLRYTITSSDESCPTYTTTPLSMEDNTAYSIFLNSRNTTHPLFVYVDDADKPKDGLPYARTLSNVAAGSTISWKNTKSGKIEHEEPAYVNNRTEFSTGTYEIMVDTKTALEFTMATGGSYAILIHELPNGNLVTEIHLITEPNSVHMLWLVPQYVVMTLGEVMYSVTGLEFSYSQAPLSMKSVLQACWLLTVAFGNVVVVIIAEAKIFDSQAYEFFLFAGIMFVDMCIFMWVAYRYIPNVPKTDSEVQPLTGPEATDETKEIPLGIDNKAKEIED